MRAPLVEFSAREIGRAAFGYNVPMRRSSPRSSEAADAAGIVRLDAMAAAIRPMADAVSIDAGDAGMIEARLVGAADGRNSPARTAAGIDVRRWSYPQAALVVNISHTLPH